MRRVFIAASVSHTAMRRSSSNSRGIVFGFETMTIKSKLAGLTNQSKEPVWIRVTNGKKVTAAVPSVPMRERTCRRTNRIVATKGGEAYKKYDAHGCEHNGGKKGTRTPHFLSPPRLPHCHRNHHTTSEYKQEGHLDLQNKTERRRAMMWATFFASVAASYCC